MRLPVPGPRDVLSAVGRGAESVEALLAELREVVDQLHQCLDLVGVRGLGEAVERRLERGQRRLEGVEQSLQARELLVGDVDDARGPPDQGAGR